MRFSPIQMCSIPFRVDRKALEENFMTYPVVIVLTPFAIVMIIAFIVLSLLLGTWVPGGPKLQVPISAPTVSIQRVGKLPGEDNPCSISNLLTPVVIVMGYNSMSTLKSAVVISYPLRSLECLLRNVYLPSTHIR